MSTEQNLIKELITLLANQRLDQEAISRITEVVTKACHDPEGYIYSEEDGDMSWLLETDPEGITTWAIYSELIQFFIISDKIDEFHEQVQEQFEGGPIPDFPYGQFPSTDEYFVWINKLLKAMPQGYQLISFGDSYGDNLQGVIVDRAATHKIMALCQTLNVKSSESFY